MLKKPANKLALLFMPVRDAEGKAPVLEVYEMIGWLPIASTRMANRLASVRTSARLRLKRRVIDSFHSGVPRFPMAWETGGFQRRRRFVVQALF